MKKNLRNAATALALITTTLPATAATVLIDFGYNVGTPPATAQHYNYSYTTPFSGNLTDTTGAATNFTFTTNAVGITGSGGVGTAYTSANSANAWASWNAATGSADASVAGATGNSVAGGAATATFGNLIAGQTYSVFLLFGNGGDGTNVGNSKSLTITGVDTSTVGSWNWAYTAPSANPSIIPTQSSTLNSATLSTTSNTLAGASPGGGQAFAKLDFIALSDTVSVNYAYSTTGSILGIQAIGLQGTAAIPEPSTYALAGGVLALGVALVVRRRRKN